MLIQRAWNPFEVGNVHELFPHIWGQRKVIWYFLVNGNAKMHKMKKLGTNPLIKISFPMSSYFSAIIFVQLIRTMLAIIVLTSLIWSVSASAFMQDGNTALAIKQNFQAYNNTIPIGISNFKELTRKSPFFIDNTLFCLEVKKASSLPFLMTSPSQWGKTTLLTMLKAFLEIEVDKDGNKILPKESTTNYRLFVNGEVIHVDGRREVLQSRLLIAEEEKFVEIHQGNFPVIYVTFKEALGKEYLEVERRLGLAVAQAFKDHDYLLRVLEKKVNDAVSNTTVVKETELLERLREHLSVGKENMVDQFKFVSSLRLLSELLEWYFHEKPCILIDDYDTPMQSFFRFDNFPKSDIYRISSLLEAFLTTTTTGNAHYGHAIIMGTLQMEFLTWEKYTYRHILDNKGRKSLREYFGFKEPHVKFLFEKNSITGKLAQRAQQWYNGYESVALGKNFYNPISIVRFLHRKNITYYRPQTNYYSFIQRVLRVEPSLEGMLLSLLSERGTTLAHKNQKVFQWMYHYQFQENSTDIDLINEAFLTFFNGILWAEQYVTEKIAITKDVLSNCEAACLLANWMITYYQQKFFIENRLLDNAAIALLEIVRTERTDSELLKVSLAILYGKCYRNTTQSKRMAAISILNCVALRMQCMAKFEVVVNYNYTGTGDIVIYDPEIFQGAVIELCPNRTSAEQKQETSVRHKNTFKMFPHIQKAKMIQLTSL